MRHDELERAALGVELAEREPGGGLPKLRGAAELYDTRAGEIRTLIDGILTDGLTIFAGRQKGGKSWLALQLAIAAAGGRQVEGLSFTESRCSVLYGALEEPAARTGARLRKLDEKGDWLLSIGFFYELLPLMGGGADQLRALIQQTEPRLVILDSLTAVVRASGRQAGDVFRSQYAEVDTLRKIAEEARVAMLLIHHLRKGIAGDPIEAIAGTGGISAAVDSAWVLKRMAEGDCTLEVTGREIEERSLALRFEREDPFGWRFLGDGGELALSSERRQILEVLREEGGMSPAKLAVEIGKSRPAVRQLIRRMVADDLIRKKHGSYFACDAVTPPYSLTRVTEGGNRESERGE